MSATHKPRTMKAYNFTLKSTIARHSIKIKAIIFAESFADADQFLYWKILSEFSPQEYIQIVSKATRDTCTQEALPPEECTFARRGLIFFRATCDEAEIRSLEIPRPWSEDKNWHKGMQLTFQRLAFPIMAVLYLTLLALFIYTQSLF